MGGGESGAERSLTCEFSPVYFVTPEEAKTDGEPRLHSTNLYRGLEPLFGLTAIELFPRICYSSPSVHVKTMQSYSRVDV